MLGVDCYDLWCFDCSMGTCLFMGAICCIWFRLGVSIGIGRMCIFFVIMFLSL